MSPLPKPLSIPEMHIRLSNTRRVIVREKCVFWFLLAGTLLCLGMLLVDRSLIIAILFAAGGFVTMGSRTRISRLKEMEWMWENDILRVQNAEKPPLWAECDRNGRIIKIETMKYD